MRPLRIKMTGFGPYRETNVIDMESLGRGGLYLITGDTGAGKTFIFDAITYALYGDMSGSGRDSKSVRSQYSSDGDKTEVELAFEYYGKKYIVTRNPEYYRAKKSGEGFTKQTAGATLIKPDGSVVDGSSKVTEEIKRILGLDRGQFCNICMIAQGEFRKVLNAGTEERQKLFRKLFNTQPYSRLSEELKDLNKRNQDKYNDGIRTLSLCLSSVNCSFDEELSEKLEKLKDRTDVDPALSGEICGLLVSITEEGKKRSVSLSEDLRTIDDKLTALNNTIALAKDHRKNVNSLEEARNAKPLLKEKHDGAKESLDAANGKKPDIEILESEAALIEASMVSYDELDAISIEKTKISKDLENKAEELTNVRTLAESLRNKLTESETILDELRLSGEKLIKTGNRIEKAESRVNVLRELIEDIEEAAQQSETLKKKQDELDPLIDEAGRLETEHSMMLSAYMREQAGILAGSLVDGEPCPVCGSVHHPKPAELSREAPSADDIEEKKKEAGNARDKASGKMSEVQTAKGNLDAVMVRTRALALRETGSEDLSSAKVSAENEISSLNESLAGMRRKKKELLENTEKAKSLSRTIPELKASLEEKETKARDLEKKINKINEELAAVQARYKQVRKELSYDSKDDAEAARAAKVSEALKYKKDIENAAEELNDAAAGMHANEAKITELERVVAGYEPVDEASAIEEAASAASEKDSFTEQSIQIASEINSAEAALISIRAGTEELNRIRREHEVIDSLNRTANGLLTGKERITLESYVQAFYFERIIRHANIRLRMMSDGQYEFVRSGGAGDKRHLSGLDLSVLDHYSGTERPVSTLSGGESFMASLSLALGLSDEVQSSAGGIRLDTMFVDEGFGSLDSETLEKAMRTLTELADEEKLVGIISHVDALKSRIDRQIVVTKDRDAGSKATVII